MLLRLLHSVVSTRLDYDGVDVLELLVVDNDPKQSARYVIEEIQTQSQLPIRYIPEPERGLVSARNRALSEAVDANLLIFLDDDEWVDSNWFVELVGTLIHHGAQFVIGPVRPVFPAEASAIYERSGLFHRAEFPNGHAVSTGNTGNCCIDLDWLRKHGIRFAAQYNRTGGEDEALFLEMTRLGAIGRYAARALVFEPVSQERISVIWLLRRRVRIGANIVSQKVLADCLGVPGRTRLGLEGLVRALVGFVLALVLFIVAPHMALKYSAASARGIGYLIGALGVKIHDY